MKSLDPEVIRALTPIFLATIGGLIGIVCLVWIPEGNSAKWSSGLGLASTAIAGAAGLARTSKDEPDFSVKQQDGNVEVKTPGEKN